MQAETRISPTRGRQTGSAAGRESPSPKPKVIRSKDGGTLLRRSPVKYGNSTMDVIGTLPETVTVRSHNASSSRTQSPQTPSSNRAPAPFEAPTLKRTKSSPIRRSVVNLDNTKRTSHVISPMESSQADKNAFFTANSILSSVSSHSLDQQKNRQHYHRLSRSTSSSSNNIAAAASSITSHKDDLVSSSSTTPIKSHTTTESNARSQRKIEDLEISNQSLLAINKLLEEELSKQKQIAKQLRLMIPVEHDQHDNNLPTTPDAHQDLLQHVTTRKHQNRSLDESLQRSLLLLQHLIKEGQRALQHEVDLSEITFGTRVLSLTSATPRRSSNNSNSSSTSG